MKKQIIVILVILSILVLVFSVLQGMPTHSQNGYNIELHKKLKEIPQSTWNKLAGLKIFFGHHSVGTNILQGIDDIKRKNPDIKLNIVNLRKLGNTINFPAFVHGNVGKNTDPESKINSFREKIEAGYGQDLDIAFFKFCFVDFTPETNIEDIFNLYKSTLDSLVKEYPRTTFVVVTTPLTCYAPGPHGWVKRTKDIIKAIIGKLNVYDHSSANIFNRLLIQEYKGKLPIFDLARIESTKSDGSRIFHKKDNEIYYELNQKYTTDGGHLNETGRQIVAENLLLLLAKLAK